MPDHLWQAPAASAGLLQCLRAERHGEAVAEQAATTSTRLGKIAHRTFRRMPGHSVKRRYRSQIRVNGPRESTNSGNGGGAGLWHDDDLAHVLVALHGRARVEDLAERKRLVNPRPQARKLIPEVRDTAPNHLGAFG